MQIFETNEAGYVECQNNMDCPTAFTDKDNGTFITYHCTPQTDMESSICRETTHDYCESPSRAANEPKCREFDLKAARCEEDNNDMKECNEKEVFAGEPIRLTGGLGGVGTIR